MAKIRDIWYVKIINKTKIRNLKGTFYIGKAGKNFGICPFMFYRFSLWFSFLIATKNPYDRVSAYLFGFNAVQMCGMPVCANPFGLSSLPPGWCPQQSSVGSDCCSLFWWTHCAHLSASSWSRGPVSAHESCTPVGLVVMQPLVGSGPLQQQTEGLICSMSQPWVSYFSREPGAF